MMMDLMMKDSDYSVPFGMGDSVTCNDDLMLITNENKGTEEPIRRWDSMKQLSSAATEPELEKYGEP